MQVDLENLEPGSVVETPKELVKHRDISASHVIYTGMLDRFPRFMVPSKDLWLPVYWPKVRSYSGYCDCAPVPRFEVAENHKLIKEFGAGWLQNDLGLAGDVYASGCDPEIFVMNNSKVIPARTVLPKKGKYTLAFYDGIQAEFTPSGGACLEGLGTRIRKGLREVQKHARARHLNAKLAIQNSIQLTQEEMDSLADEDVAFQCSESINIYNDIPGIREPRKYLWRFAGGHIHVGACDSIRKPLPLLHSMVRAMDGILGVASVSLARSFDTPERRKNYGRAGECRFPSHGLEYRVLSNFWLCSPLIYHLVFEIARWAYRLGETGVFQAAWDGSEQEIRECINNCDVPLAQELIKRNAGIYSKCFAERWGSSPNFYTTKAMDTIMNGLEVVVQDPTEIEGNWCLGLHDDDWGPYGNDVPNSKWRCLKCS